MLRVLSALAWAGASIAGASHLRLGHFGPSTTEEHTSLTATETLFLQERLSMHTDSGGEQLQGRLSGIQSQKAKALVQLKQSCADSEAILKEKHKDATNIFAEKKASCASPGGGAWPEIEAAYEKAMAEVRDETVRLVADQQHVKEAADRRAAAALSTKRAAEAHHEEIKLAYASAKKALASGSAAASVTFHEAQKRAQEAEAGINVDAATKASRILKEAEARHAAQKSSCDENYKAQISALDEEIDLARNIKGPLDELINRCKGVKGGEGEYSRDIISPYSSLPEECADAHREYTRAQSSRNV